MLYRGCTRPSRAARAAPGEGALHRYADEGAMIEGEEFNARIQEEIDSLLGDMPSETQRPSAS